MLRLERAAGRAIVGEVGGDNSGVRGPAGHSANAAEAGPLSGQVEGSGWGDGRHLTVWVVQPPTTVNVEHSFNRGCPQLPTRACAQIGIQSIRTVHL